MNYFTSLLVAAGLAAGPVSAQPPVLVWHAAAPSNFSIASTGYWAAPSAVATPQQAYQTMSAWGIQTGGDAASSRSPSGGPAASPKGAADSGGSSSAGAPGTAATMVQLINQARRAHGLPPYAINETLMRLAQVRANALAADGVFTSDLPGLGWPVQMEQAAGIAAAGMGAENIAEASTVGQAFSLLMASAPHRANILDPSETQVGVGVAKLPNGVAISELFLGPNL